MFKSLYDATVCPAALTSTCGNHACHISMLTVDSFLLRTLLNVVPTATDPLHEHAGHMMIKLRKCASVFICFKSGRRHLESILGFLDWHRQYR